VHLSILYYQVFSRRFLFLFSPPSQVQVHSLYQSPTHSVTGIVWRVEVRVTACVAGSGTALGEASAGPGSGRMIFAV